MVLDINRHLPWYLRLNASPLLVSIALTVTLGLAFWVTYSSGGSATSFPHLFYIPIIIAAFFLRYPGTLLVCIIAGILCGPLMPNVRDFDIPQTLDNWLLRLLFFTVIGLLTTALAQGLRNQLTILRDQNTETILAFVKAVDAKDPYTANHSIQVAKYAVAIAETMGLRPVDADRVRWTALLHDIGKLAVPEAVLQKEGELSPEEWDIIKQHPERAVEIVSRISNYHDLILGIRQHHERMDGKGYPDGICSDSVCLDARIIAVADAYDAMTSDRPYRDALDPDEALNRIQQGAGTQFDPRVVKALEDAIAHNPKTFKRNKSAGGTRESLPDALSS